MHGSICYRKHLNSKFNHLKYHLLKDPFKLKNWSSEVGAVTFENHHSASWEEAMASKNATEKSNGDIQHQWTSLACSLFSWWW